LLNLAGQLDLRLQIRDLSYAEFLSSSETPLGFISHDSRNKVELVEPLASALRSMLCPVWYDDYSLLPGQSVRESIDRGLRESRRCVLILSPEFLSNPGWTKGEFNAAVNRHFSSGGTDLIPVWHRVSAAEVREYSPLVADIVALRSDVGIEELTRRLYRALLKD